MGKTTYRELIYDLGGGIPGDRAAQGDLALRRLRPGRDRGRSGRAHLV